jgi:peptidoglycan/xylan/chitin deacetylase (PgdA/CDA1 family)
MKFFYYITIAMIGLLTLVAPTNYALAADFSEGVVSVEFDDGWKSAYTNGLPIAEKYGFESTQAVIANANTQWSNTEYMSDNEIRDWSRRGHDIASHSMNHPDLTTLSNGQVRNELNNSKNRIQRIINKPVTYFVAPYCAFENREIRIAKSIYKVARNCFTGVDNSGSQIKINNLNSQIVDKDTTKEQIASWVNEAKANKTLLIFVYHAVPEVAVESTEITKANFEEHMQTIKNSGVKVMTTMKALKYFGKI